MQHVLQTDIRPHQEAHESEEDDKQILPQHPLGPAQAIRPEGDDLDKGREDQGQSGATERPHQRNHRPQVGDGDGKNEGYEHQDGSGDVFGYVFSLLGLEMLPDAGPHYVEGHVELQAVGEEDRYGHH